MNRAVQVGGLVTKEGVEHRTTDGFILEGGDGWHPTSFIRLIQDYGLDTDVSDSSCNRVAVIVYVQSW